MTSGTSETSRTSGHYRGRVALFAILQEIGVEPGEPVVVPAFTCSAVAEALLAAGTAPRWIDVESCGVTLSADALDDALTATGARIALVQSTFGIPPDHDVWRVLSAHNAIVVEDLCHVAPGTRFAPPEIKNQWYGFHSFEFSKPLVGGRGGVALRGDGSEIAGGAAPSPRHEAKLAAEIVVRGAALHPSTYWFFKRRFSRAGSSAAALGTFAETLPRPDALPEDYSLAMARSAKTRLRVAERMAGRDNQRVRDNTAALRRVVGAPVANERIDGSAMLSRYPVFVEDRPALLELASNANVEVATWFETPIEPLVGDDLRAVHYEPGACPNAEWAAAHIVSLPLRARLSKRYLNRLAKVFALAPLA